MMMEASNCERQIQQMFNILNGIPNYNINYNILYTGLIPYIPPSLWNIGIRIFNIFYRKINLSKSDNIG